MKVEEIPYGLVEQLRAWFFAKDRSVCLADNCFVEVDEQAKPGTPAAGRRRLYPKVRGWYDLDGAGAERPVGQLRDIRQASGNTDINTNSSVFATMTSCTVTVTVTGETWDVLVWASASVLVACTAGTSQIAQFRINRDNAEYIVLGGTGGYASTHANSFVGAAGGVAYFQAVAAGAHTFTLEWSVSINAGPTVYNNCATGGNAYIRRILALSLARP